jgi:hypothetical protein
MKKIFTNILLVVLVFSFSMTMNANAKNHSDYKLERIGVDKVTNVSDDYRLYQNFPNPFNPATIVSYKINQSGFVTLKVYNLVGQVVKTLVSEYQEPGTYTERFDASELSAGIYLYKLQVNGFTSVKRMTLIK